MPKASEVARLTVNGVNFEDWETVSVSLVLRGNPPQLCRFTLSEGKLAKTFALMQILPGVKCTVTLAGELAFNGTVVSRQVFVDAHRHHVEIQACSNLTLSTASVISKTGEFKNAMPEQIIRSVLKGVGKNLTVLGGSLPNIKIPRYSATPGESIIDFIDTLTRHLSQETNIGIAHSATPEGEFAIVVGDYGGSDTVVEGKNMLEGREIIYIPNSWAEGGGGRDDEAKGPTANQSTTGQRPGNDKTWGADVAHAPFLSKTFDMMGQKIVPSVIVPEMPLWDKQITQGRATAEKGWMVNDYITVYVTLQGWLRPSSGGLWIPGQDVVIISPMLVMNGTPLKLKSATFSQDNQSGSRTILECCNAKAIAQGPVKGE